MAKRWYIVQAYSNFERKVAEDIRQKVAQKKLAMTTITSTITVEIIVSLRVGQVTLPTS